MRHVCPECGDAGERGPCPGDGTLRVPASSDPLLGTVIGSWRVARLLGAGGMGRVYLAVQPAIGARVAIKVLKREAAADADLVERFFNEARAVNVIRHEGIVDVIDLGRLPDGSPYIVMEHLDGASLGALFRRHRPFPLGTLARLVGEVLAALAAAHAKTIIHRDLKPDNVFVSPAGRVTVLDFGIAKLAVAEGMTTQTGSLLGTPAYMAPEQALSQPVDARTDLYAAGVILYEGATGAPPFAASSLYELLDLQVKAQPAAPRSKNPAIPEPLEAVIERALAKAPADRFATATAMRDALLAAVAELPPSAFVEVSIEPAVTPGPPSDPFAPTAATQGSLARGETMPSEPRPPNKRVPRSAHVQLSRRTAFALAGVAVLGVGAAAVMALRDPEERATPHRVAVIDAPQPDAAPRDAAPLDAAPPDAAPPDAALPDAALADAAIAVVRRFRDAGVTAAAIIQRPDGGYPIAVTSPATFDPLAFIATATAVAEKITGGEVYLYHANLRGVDRAGRMDLLGQSTVAVYHFTSVVRAKAHQPCVLFVEAAKGEAVLRFANECTRNKVLQRKCTLPEVWQKALDLGLPADVTRGNMNRVGRTWQFSSGGWSEPIVDDC